MFSIIYRDLKPDNIGFDVRGDVKIFDFGLAKEINPKKKLDDGTYNLTADTGSLRYMAPEGKEQWMVGVYVLRWVLQI
jgi:serine/threonine protein kinase